MDSEAKRNDELVRYRLLVASLVEAVVESLRIAKGDSVSVRSAIEVFVKKGYSAGLTSGELTDFFCVDSPSVLDQAGYCDAEAEKATIMYDDLNTLYHQRMKR